MRLHLPFIVLPLAALATPFGEPDNPVYPKAGNFSFSCRDFKLDGKSKDDPNPGDALHHLVATCTAGDGTEITSKLDLNHCYALYKSQNDGNGFGYYSKCSIRQTRRYPQLDCERGNEPHVLQRTQFSLDGLIENDHGYLKCFDHKGERV
ncbi:hypothetical protein BDV34DRAFT_188393 [Aspergillus parasiticus]|uniref:Cyanovirin-N domain-containing protein n=1 Tax=Aspergillus parasiticus TaxID=5067 RepID=A0A5N6DWB6_ASPPA|nr:hypothetical protein BDV34DRAFT_188393 [Aspergillus parasiticus]